VEMGCCVLPCYIVFCAALQAIGQPGDPFEPSVAVAAQGVIEGCSLNGSLWQNELA